MRFTKIYTLYYSTLELHAKKRFSLHTQGADKQSPVMDEMTEVSQSKGTVPRNKQAFAVTTT